MYKRPADQQFNSYGSTVVQPLHDCGYHFPFRGSVNSQAGTARMAFAVKIGTRQSTPAREEVTEGEGALVHPPMETAELLKLRNYFRKNQ